MNFLRTLAQNPGKTALSIAAAAGISHSLTQASQWQAAQDQVFIDAPYTPNALGPVASPPNFYTQRFGDLNAQAHGFSHPMKNPLINNPAMDFYATRSLSSGEKMGRIFAKDVGLVALFGGLAWGALALIQGGLRRKTEQKNNGEQQRKAVSDFVNDNLTDTHQNHASFLKELNTFLDRHDLLQGWNTKQTHYLLKLILKKITSHLDQHASSNRQDLANLSSQVKAINSRRHDMTAHEKIREFLTALKTRVNAILNKSETTTRDGHGDPWAMNGTDRTQTLDVNGNRIGGEPVTLPGIAVDPTSGTTVSTTTSEPQILIANETNRGNPANDPTEFNALTAKTPFAEFHAVTTYGGANSKYGSLNEDSAGAVASGDGIAVVVTDGAGGEGKTQTDAKGNEYKGGYASGKTATEALVKSLQGDADLATALKAAHDAILKGQSGGMATVALVHVDKDLTIKAARVGDTQILIVRNGAVFFRSIPQNRAWLFHYIFPLASNQQSELAKVYQAQNANVVDYLLGFTPKQNQFPLNLDPQATHEANLKEYTRFYFDPIQGEVGDQILLMGDGVIDNVSEYEILELAKQFRGKELAQKIRQLALERNNTTHPERMITIQLDQGQTVEKKVTRDNITVGVLELKSTETGTDLGDGDGEEEQNSGNGENRQHALSAAAKKDLRRKARKGLGPLSTMELPVNAEIALVTGVRTPPPHNEDDDWLAMPTDTSPSRQQGIRPPDSDEDWDISPAPAPLGPQNWDTIDTREDLEVNPEIALASGLENFEIDLGGETNESWEIDLPPADSTEGEDWLDLGLPDLSLYDIATDQRLTPNPQGAVAAGITRDEDDEEITEIIPASKIDDEEELKLDWGNTTLEDLAGVVEDWELGFKELLNRSIKNKKPEGERASILAELEIQRAFIEDTLSKLSAEWENNETLSHKIENLLWKIEHIIEVNKSIT